MRAVPAGNNAHNISDEIRKRMDKSNPSNDVASRRVRLVKHQLEGIFDHLLHVSSQGLTESWHEYQLAIYPYLRVVVRSIWTPKWLNCLPRLIAVFHV